ncbi:MAG: hypothetical protein EOS23_15770 [Mesorhizobium sp.]|uniref:hypothetical protein n=1 Tax=Mesorhizobium sp. TaxID=1871066 RepID=UPI000FE9F6CA|nr:hypothetical protein [Mesorhizobium sp.]RWC43795.1 MAG: hypothetical protein EOS28_11475 [Mesorhizobium sp.]RWE10818.1 MAG: hypothetical protein EOS23_15770 [Mesorhizobium sp.]RWE92657.1 MAG: hypothetical protein EOS68_25105 [Mesorhizobium sp.]TIS63045.1 MAG: hypothetical protein E5W92_28770 [Mesorhizobium sp.]
MPRRAAAGFFAISTRHSGVLFSTRFFPPFATKDFGGRVLLDLVGLVLILTEQAVEILWRHPPQPLAEFGIEVSIIGVETMSVTGFTAYSGNELSYL